MRYIFIFFVSFIFFGCKKDEQVPEPEPDYVRGELSFGIKDEVSIDKVFQLINDEHLDIEKIHGFTYTCAYPKDSLLAVRSYLAQKQYLKWPSATSATDTPYSFYVENIGIKISAPMFGMSDTALQNDWLRTISHLGLIDNAVTFKNAHIHVPEGTEKEWRDKLLQKEIVEWVELNYIVELDPGF